ncbi:hypothetical protein Tco_0310197, partial [Tanacetum coccineum]
MLLSSVLLFFGSVGVSTPAAAFVNNAGIFEFHSTDYRMPSVSTLDSTVNSVEIPIVGFSGDHVPDTRIT